MTTAEGGMVCTSDSQMADRLRVSALHGMSRDAWKRFSDDGYRHYEVVTPGFKYNMTDIQAALGLCQLSRLRTWLKRREAIWAQYDAAFADLPCTRPAPPAPDTVHARHLYTLLLDIDALGKTRDQVMKELHERGIGTGVHYVSVHLHKYYRDRFGFTPEDYPVANWISQRTVSINMAPKLSDQDVERIIAAVREVVSAGVVGSTQVSGARSTTA
jgi:dTDP-4-amino-4,6-dideoxygalactose transaminase